MDDLGSAPGASTNWQDTFDFLKGIHDQAYTLIDEGLTLEAAEKKDDALAKYNAGLTQIDRALSVKLVCPPNPNLSWERACIMVQKMKVTKKEVMSRMADLQAKCGAPAVSLSTDPPSYDEAMTMASSGASAMSPVAGPSTSTSSGHVGPAPRTYGELAEALNSLKMYQSRLDSSSLKNPTKTVTARGRNFQIDSDPGEAELLFAHDNVRLYFISPDGTVSASSEPDRLQIVMFSEEKRGNRPPAYLQVGNWIYPLVPGVSPCFRTNYRAFILPDIHSDIEGSAVGLILPEDADESVFELLESILEEIMLELVDERPGRMRRDAAEVGFAHSIVRGARFVSSKLISGAERASSLMNRGTPILLDHLDQEQPKPINPTVSKGFQVAKDVSGKAVQVTGYVASKVGLATSALGRFLSPHIQKQGTKLLSNTFKMEEAAAKQRMENVLQVTAGAVEAFGTVYGGLEHSARILGGSLANNTVRVVQHKYGQQAGQIADNTLDTVGNVFIATSTVKRLNPKNLVKISVKATGRAVIEEQQTHLRAHTSDPSAAPSSSLAKEID